MEEEFEVDINEAEPQFLQGQSSRSGVEVGIFLAFSLDFCCLSNAMESALQAV